MTTDTIGQPTTAPRTIHQDLTNFWGFQTMLLPDASTPFMEIYDRYLLWCATAKEEARPYDWFGQRLGNQLPGITIEGRFGSKECVVHGLVLANDSEEDVAAEDTPPILTQKDRVLHVATNIAVALMLLCGGLACSIANKDLFATVFFTAAVVYVLCVDWRS